MVRSGQVIALCVLALLVIGVVMVNSALMTVGGQITPEKVLTSRSTIYLALAMGALAVTALVPILGWIPGVRRYQLGLPETQPGLFGHWAKEWGPKFEPRFGGWAVLWLWIASGILAGLMLIVYIPGVGREVNGSHRWINLSLPVVGDMSAQPSEIGKWALIGLMAWYAVRMKDRMRSFLTGLLPGLVAAGVVCAVIVVEDLGTAVLIGAVAAIVLIAGGARFWQFLLMLPIAAVAFVAAVVANPYRIERIQSFIDPYLDPQGKGFHMIQSMLAVSGGEVHGRGLGHGLQKFGYLPEDQTDFLFAIICEELGIFGAAAVIALYGLLIWSSLSVIRRQQNPVLKLVGIGVIATVGLQALINMAVVTGLGPTKGIALPLLSSGGTGWILTAACLGLLVNMDRTGHRYGAVAMSPSPASPGPSTPPQDHRVSEASPTGGAGGGAVAGEGDPPSAGSPVVA
jgi:cell division protein FtsW